jgi:hypothetical protein
MVVLCVALFTLLVLFSTRMTHLHSLPPISPNCYLPKSGRHVTSLDQRSGKSLGTRLPKSLYADNLVPRACDLREGTWGSGIIRFREESDWPLIWNAQFDLSQKFLASGNGLSQSLTFLPEDRRLGERDWYADERTAQFAILFIIIMVKPRQTKSCVS